MKHSLPGLAGAFAALIAACGVSAAQDSRLRMSSPFPEAHFVWQEGGKIFADAVREQSGGAIDFEFYHAGQLGRDQHAIVNSRLADIVIAPTVYTPERFPLSGVIELPGFATTSCEATERLWELVQSGGVLDRTEYEPLDLHVIWAYVPPPYKVMTSRAKVATIEDLRGLKLRTVGGAQADTVRRLGAVPIQVQASEFYDSAMRGTIDGAIYAFVGMPPYDLGDVFKQTAQGFFGGSSANLIAMRRADWEALPEETRTILSEAGAKAQQAICEYMDRDEDAIRDEYVAEKGLVVTEVSEEEQARWRELLLPVAEEWAAQMDRNGLAGTEVLEAYRTTGEAQ